MFWDILWGKPEKTYSKEEVEHLLEMVKKFDAGAIDAYLSKHVDKAYARWLIEYED